MIPNRASLFACPHCQHPTPHHERRMRYLELVRIVQFTDASELPALLDRALARGARLDCATSYDEHLLVIAARRDCRLAINALLARGAPLPNVPPTGINLMMEAAAAGHADMLATLADVAGMDVFAADSSGWSILHHAVLGESAAVIDILLGYGLDPDARTAAMDGAVLASVFGAGTRLSGVNVTPLMMACAAGSDDIVRQLLEAGADPYLGPCAPLIIAARAGHAATVALLLAAGVKPGASVDEFERATLPSLLEDGIGWDCLPLVAAHHEFDGDGTGTESPLAIALERGSSQQVALLLGSGAVPGDDEPDTETVWDVARRSGERPGALLDLLAAARPRPPVSEDASGFAAQLRELARDCADPVRLASHGWFPSLWRGWAQPLDSLAATLPTATPQQLALRAAHLCAVELGTRLPAAPPRADRDADPGLRWQLHTSREREVQRAALLRAALAVGQQAKQALDEALTLERFAAWDSDCPPDVQLRDFVRGRLREQDGLPDPIADCVAGAWAQAEEWTLDWQVAERSLPQRTEFIGRLARTLARVAFARIDAGHDEWLQSLKQHALQGLAADTRALDRFCANPVRWLRQLENRHDLRPVNTGALASVIQFALCLPPDNCRRIAEGWSYSIATVRLREDWQTPAALQAALERQLAVDTGRWLGGADAARIADDAAAQALQQWAVRASADLAPATTVVIARSGLRKRFAEAEPDNAPTGKQPRL